MSFGRARERAHTAWQPGPHDAHGQGLLECREGPNVECHEKSARYITVTLPLHYRYITVTSPLHHGYVTRILGARRGVLVAVAAVKTRRRLARTLGRVRGAGTGMEPSLGHDRCGSLQWQWLLARVMSGLPDGIPSGTVAAQTPATSSARGGVPHSRTTCSASRAPSSIPRHRPPVPRY